jgi:choline dehydrogenase
MTAGAEPGADTDYLVIGAGSAGCVVASRLSETGARVALLEAGPRDRHPWIHVPAGVLKLLRDPRVNWNYADGAGGGSGGRALHWPRGRVLGGSSSINGMLYVRGNPADFDGWAQMGCRGWGYDDVLPYFRKSEHYGPGDPAFRGKGGVLRVEDYRTVLLLTHRFVEAAQQAGHAFRRDLNGEGAGGGRLLPDDAQRALPRLHGDDVPGRGEEPPEPPRRDRRGRHAVALRGPRCVGAAFRQAGEDAGTQGGAGGRPVRRRRELASAPATIWHRPPGAPAEHRRRGGGDAPGVGANLQDHYVARVSHRVAGAVSINELARGARLAGEVLRFALRGRGALTFGVTSAQVFCRSREGLASPDLQLLFTPASYDPRVFGALEREPGMTVAVCPVRPESRGTVTARSPDPFEKPAIRPNYLASRSDRDVLAAGIRLTREIFAAPALAQHAVRETVPGPDVVSDADLHGYMRDFGTTLYHPVGTCRMGGDPASVVDARLRVRGVGGLRVVDAS